MTENAFKTQLRSEIDRAIQTHGGSRALSLLIGKSPGFVSKVMERNRIQSLINLQKLIKEIK